MGAILSGLVAGIITEFLLLGGTPVRATNGDIVVANQCHGELHATLASGAEFGEVWSPRNRRRPSKRFLRTSWCSGAVGNPVTGAAKVPDSGLS